MPESAARPLSIADWRPTDSGYPVSILVVDDDEWIRELIVGTLSENGYRVRMAACAEEAIEMLRNSAFDLVLSDVKMPGMDGIALSRTLAQTHPGLPVVLVTGFGHVDLARAALQYGASDFITKPFNLDSIGIVVERNLERRRLERKRVLEQDDKIMFKAIQALAAAIDAKQSYTAQHSRRVAALAMVIGRKVNLNRSELRCLEFAAHVHDVGKIGVPDSVLNKEGKLDAAEWEAMREHPAKGAEIVGQVDELAYVADIVRHHHERMDGNGYPDGLRGESIPFLSRIITVADAYECMTSDRVYRPRLPVDEALRRLHESCETQFDPYLVEVFAQLHRDRQIL